MSPALETEPHWLETPGVDAAASVLVLDLETLAMGPLRDGESPGGAPVASSWKAHREFGVSVCAVGDLCTDERRVFLSDNKAELGELFAARRFIVTWNGDRFDLPILAACWGIDVPNSAVSVDLCSLVHAALRLQVDEPRIYGITLDRLLAANDLPGKTDKGALAPRLWLEGQCGRVIDYCMQDMDRTGRLLERAFAGPLALPINDSAPPSIPRSVDLAPALERIFGGGI